MVVDDQNAARFSLPRLIGAWFARLFGWLDDCQRQTHDELAALTDDRHVGETYELTGPRLLTFADAAAEISAATGRAVRYVPVSVEEHEAFCLEHGVPEVVVELLTHLFTSVLDGRNAHVTDGVRRALGRDARDFGEYARTAAAAGVWDVDREEVA